MQEGTKEVEKLNWSLLLQTQIERLNWVLISSEEAQKIEKNLWWSFVR